MAMQLIVVNAQQQKQMISLTKGEQVVVAKGDTIRLLSKMDIKTLRKGNDLIIKNAKGEEFVLKDFYAKAEKSQEVKTLSWDDPLGDEKELFSEEYSESIKVAANDSGVTSDATTQGGAGNNPSSTGGENVVAGSEGDRSPAAIAAALLGLGGVVGAVALANSGSSNNNRPTVAKNSVGAVTDNNGDTNTVAENAANDTLVGITALATDPDAGDTVSYSLTDDAGGRFKINSSTGVVSVADGTLLNYEAATSHTITVKASSSDGSSKTANMIINVTDVTETATFSISGLSDSSVDENTAYTSATPSLTGTPIGAVTYSLGGADKDLFSVDAAGVVTMVARDFEAPADAGANNVYNYTLIATDADGNTDSQDVAVTVNDVNEAPTVANIIPDQTSGWTKDSAGSFTFAANTFDDVDAGDTLTYSATLEGGADLSTIGLSFDSATRMISGTPNAAGTYNIVVTATDTSAASVSDTFALTVGAAGATAPALLAGNLDNLANLDVRSQIVLEFDQDIILGSGQIRIKDDMGTSGWSITNNSDPINPEFLQDTTDNDMVITIGFDPVAGKITVTDMTIGGVGYASFGGAGITLEEVQKSITVSGNKLIINPAGSDDEFNNDWDFDWDFGANYHVELEAGVVKNVSGTLGNAEDLTTVNFTTVAPTGDPTGAVSQQMLADGTLSAGYIWHHGHVLNDNTSGLTYDFATGSHALYVQSNGGTTRTTTMSGKVTLQNFGFSGGVLTSDDLLYMDNNGIMGLATTDGLNGGGGWASGTRTLSNAGGFAERIIFDQTGFPAPPGPWTNPSSDTIFENSSHYNHNVIVFG